MTTEDPVRLKIETGGLGIRDSLAELIESGKERRRCRHGQDVCEIAILSLVERLRRNTLQEFCRRSDVVSHIELIAVVEREERVENAGEIRQTRVRSGETGRSA